MKAKTNTHRRLHLVTAEAASITEQKPPASDQQEVDSFIANGIRRCQELQQAFDRELFGSRDLEKIGEILPELQMLRERLEAYGIYVRC